MVWLQEIEETAQLDGCNHFCFFGQTVMPLSKAIICAELLYYAVYHWNDYFNALIYNSNSDYEPLQMVLRAGDLYIMVIAYNLSTHMLRAQ